MEMKSGLWACGLLRRRQKLSALRIPSKLLINGNFVGMLTTGSAELDKVLLDGSGEFRFHCKLTPILSFASHHGLPTLRYISLKFQFT